MYYINESCCVTEYGKIMDNSEEAPKELIEFLKSRRNLTFNKCKPTVMDVLVDYLGCSPVSGPLEGPKQAKE